MEIHPVCCGLAREGECLHLREARAVFDTTIHKQALGPPAPWRAADMNLGVDTVAQRSLPQVGLTLSMASKTGTSGEAGDKYSGLDRFGRTVDQRWSTSSGTDIDRYQYAYDVGNPTIRANLLSGKPVAIYCLRRPRQARL